MSRPAYEPRGGRIVAIQAGVRIRVVRTGPAEPREALRGIEATPLITAGPTTARVLVLTTFDEDDHVHAPLDSAPGSGSGS
ncbi:hypothetical protein ACWGIN_19840 [Streptomyces sp. NPDC054861]